MGSCYCCLKTWTLSYLIETENKELWGRHIDQLKTRTPVSHPTTDLEPEWEGPTSGSSVEPEHETSTEAAVPEPEQNPPAPETSEDTDTSLSLPVTVEPIEESGRYPQRLRQVPNYY